MKQSRPARRERPRSTSFWVTPVKIKGAFSCLALDHLPNDQSQNHFLICCYKEIPGGNDYDIL